MQGHVLDAAIGTELDTGGDGRALIRALGALAARTGMRELSVRCLAHAGRSGDGAALESARLMAWEIDNPALADLVARTSV
ncbi:hypothetical protein [Baekduia sp. Peel2402]|uniref:hypothetical protein n=1 Tax=Baekduia sp. Peel2402 TaxID=3458296 RepID=UPI00403E4E16